MSLDARRRNSCVFNRVRHFTFIHTRGTRFFVTAKGPALANTHIDLFGLSNRSKVCVDKVLASDAELNATYSAESAIKEGIEGLSKGAFIIKLLGFPRSMRCNQCSRKFLTLNGLYTGYSFCAMHMGYNGTTAKDLPFGVILQQLESELKTVEDPRVTFGYGFILMASLVEADRE